MKLHDLRPAEGATKKRKRVGRGRGSGTGKTAGRGTKGQNARSGGGVPPYFEGGQLPLVRRLPFKRGFSNIFRINYQEVNVDQLESRFDKGATITPLTLAEAGLVREAYEPVVILGRGELGTSYTIKAHRFSKSAREKIEGAGGTVVEMPLVVKGPQATVKRLPKAQLEALRGQHYTESEATE
jgi:large subunit ribosomal protein L15